jgi:hypothetical protein
MHAVKTEAARMEGFRMTSRFLGFLFSLFAAVLIALTTMSGLGAAAGASTAAATTASTTAATPAAAAAAAKAAIRRLLIGQHGTNHHIGEFSAEIKGQTQVMSNSWSGYVDTGTGFTEVNGSWNEPSATCGATEALAAFWVGIDGYNSDTVEQVGTLIECYEGTPYQYTWWEMYPANAIQIKGDTVAAGDQIYAVVSRSGSSYTLAVTDSTHSANSFTTVQTCTSCANSSAEWIAEAPSGSSGIYPLANFGEWKLTSSSVAAASITGVISTFPYAEITMVDSSGAVEAQPSALADGTSFTDTWKQSS